MFTGILVLQDTEPGKPDSYVGEVKVETKSTQEKKTEEVKDVDMKPPEEFVYDEVAQNDSH